MDLRPGQRIEDIRIDRVFIGSCTNSRIEDLRAAAENRRGPQVDPRVTALVVPARRRCAARPRRRARPIFLDAGFEWRLAGCSMCLGMNPDVLAPGERCASTSNRNFEGRQGRGGRTHLVSPQMAAAAALHGHFVDVRTLEREPSPHEGAATGHRPRGRSSTGPTSTPTRSSPSSSSSGSSGRATATSSSSTGASTRTATSGPGSSSTGRVPGRVDPARWAQLRLRLVARARRVGLQDYGIDAVVAPRSATSSGRTRGRTGCSRSCCRDEVERLMESVDLDTGSEMTVDLERCVIVAPDGREVPFDSTSPRGTGSSTASTRSP